jgi:hypothetical protein
MTEAKKPVDLSTMSGAAQEFKAQGKKYTLLPTKVREIFEFKNDNLMLWPEQQGYNIVIDKSLEILDKWLKRKVLDDKGEPMSVEKIRSEDHDWDTDDLSRCLVKLYKISG